MGRNRCALLAPILLAACAAETDGDVIFDDVETHEAPIRPRGMALQVPSEHLAVSGAVPTLVGRNKIGVAFAGPGEPPLPIYMNRFGGTYRPGRDDSRQNTSIVPNQTSQVGPYNGGDGGWAEVMACVTDMFSRFNVVVVETEPAGGEYIESVVGGSPQQVGLGRGVGGVAPIDNFNCNIIPNAIVFTFSDVVGSDPRTTCEIAAQEIAHAISLDHELHCPDPMTYLNGCGDKVFRDFDAQCGEFQARSCNCGRARQNSVQILLEKLGPSNGQPPPPPVNDPVPPVANLISPNDQATLPADSTITIVGNATDDVRVASVELV